MPSLKEIKVLYVEDDKETRDALQNFLKRRCAKVLCAADGETGFDMFLESKPDIVIADLLLPGISGLEMIKNIRDTGSKVPVLITSTVSELKTILSAVELNIDSYLIKPIETEELEEKLEVTASRLESDGLGQSHKAFPSTLERRGEMEDEIRKDFLVLLKRVSGKGASRVNVILSPIQLVIIANETLTAMEKTIIIDKKNIGLVEQCREVFYKVLIPNIEEGVFQRTGLPYKMSDIKIDATKNKDVITLTIV